MSSPISVTEYFNFVANADPRKLIYLELCSDPLDTKFGEYNNLLNVKDTIIDSLSRLHNIFLTERLVIDITTYNSEGILNINFTYKNGRECQYIIYNLDSNSVEYLSNVLESYGRNTNLTVRRI